MSQIIIVSHGHMYVMVYGIVPKGMIKLYTILVDNPGSVLTCTNVEMLQDAIHVNDICNGQIECPHGDDEYFCGLKNVKCPSNCQCLTFALKCYHNKKVWNISQLLSCLIMLYTLKTLPITLFQIY